MFEKAIRRARRSARRAQVATVYPLAALDSARRRRPPDPASTSACGGAPDVQPSGVFAAVPHWRSQPDARTAPASSVAPHDVDRSQIFVDCIKSLLDLDVDRVVVAVLTNEPRETARDLSSRLAASSSDVPVSTLPDLRAFNRPHADGRQVVVIGWRPGLIRRHGYYLTWAHKPLFRRALEDPGLSHFIYLEDDMRFTSESLAYWCRFREPLARHGLLPGFVRYEVFDDARYVVDQKARQSVDQVDRQGVVLSQPDTGRGSGLDLRFVSLNNPYQGMYVIDRELAIDHLWNSPARSSLLSRSIKWPTDVQLRAAIIRERAAIGPILDDVPPGFGSRNVVPLQMPRPGEYRLDPACLIEHLTGNYSRSRKAFGKIRVEDLFLPATSDPHAAGISPRQ